MAELIAKIILIFSFVGIIILFFKKLPALATLPENRQRFFINSLISFAKTRIENNIIPILKFDIILQKILSKIRVLTLKTENIVTNWLQILRQKAQEKNSKNNDNYWQEIKESIKEPVTKEDKDKRTPA